MVRSLLQFTPVLDRHLHCRYVVGKVKRWEGILLFVVGFLNLRCCQEQAGISCFLHRVFCGEEIEVNDIRGRRTQGHFLWIMVGLILQCSLPFSFPFSSSSFFLPCPSRSGRPYSKAFHSLCFAFLLFLLPTSDPVRFPRQSSFCFSPPHPPSLSSRHGSLSFPATVICTAALHHRDQKYFSLVNWFPTFTRTLPPF